MKLSLSAKIVLIVFGLIAATGGLTAYLVYRSSTDALQTSISSNQTSQAKQTMDKIDRFLYERQASLMSISDRQQIQDFLSTPPDQRSPATASLLVKQMNDYKTSSGSWSDLVLVDINGTLPLPNQLQNLQSVLAAQPSILKIYAAALAGQAGYSDALALIPGQAPIMLFMVPVHNNQIKEQPVVGVLVGQLAWQSNLDILRTLSDTKADLVNNKGLSLGENTPGAQKAVLSKDFSKTTAFKTARQKASGSGVLPGLENPKTNYLTSYVKESGYLDYHGNGWTLIVETPASVAFAPAKELAKTILITIAGVLVVSIIAIVLALRSLILKPVIDLKQVTGRLAHGDFSLRTTIQSGDELGSLGEDFNDMADKMQLATKKLHQSGEEAKNERTALQTVLDNLPVGVMVVKSPSGEPIMVNKTAQQMSGRPTYSDVGSTQYTETYDIIREDGTSYPPDELPLSITLKTGKPTNSDDVAFRHPDGTVVAIRSFCSPIIDNDGVIRRAIAVVEDISITRNLERSRDEFFSIASHELRTPLTAIMGNSSLIQQYYGDKLPDDDVREMVSDIHESSLRLIEIVNDFLDTSRLEQKHMKYELVDFNVMDIAKSVIKEYQVTGSRKKIHLEVIEPQSPLPLVHADKNRSKQVMINLVGNALKFTEEGKVSISFHAEPKFLKILVSDTGRGMSEDAKKLLFRKFEQTGATVLTRDSVRGTGLGLYISKLITEQMGGSIKLESSEQGVGTTFSFTLPVVTADQPHSTDDKD